MFEVIVENLINIVGALLMTLIGILGTLITSKLAQRTGLANITAAQQELIFLAQQTVGELQQTVVSKLKAAHEDGKLTEEEIKALGKALLDKTMDKLSKPSHDLLNAAGVDIVALVHGAGEDWINRLKQHN